MWVLQIHEQGEPLELAGEALSTMRSEYAELEADSITERIEEHDVIGFEMRFYYLDFVVMARVLSLRYRDRTLVLLFQAEDRDYDTLAPIFHAILVGVLRGDRKPAAKRHTPTSITATLVYGQYRSISVKSLLLESFRLLKRDG
jgi:hypothetical protein